jgi:hypothetical protein
MRGGKKAVKNCISQEGLQEGHQESHQEWMAWYERQQAALRDGQPFTEPPPAGQKRQQG